MSTVKTEMREPTRDYPYYTCLVFKYKFDTIRQESYWVCTTVKAYVRREHAEAYINRFIQDHNQT